MRQDSIRTVEFHAPDSGCAKLAWGQLNMWLPLRSFGSEAANYHLKQTAVHEAGIALEDALACIRRLVEEHQALRTTVSADGDDPEQRIHSSGTYSVFVHDAPGDYQAAVDEVLKSASTQPLPLDTTFPARFHCVSVDRRVRAIVLVISHVIADVAAARILCRRLGELMGGDAADLPGPRWEPLDQARHEQSPEGLEQERRALDYWAETLTTTPDALFHVPDPVTGPAFHRVGIESPALAAAAQRLAAELRAPTSAVLLAATCLMLGSVASAERAALKLIAGNRFTPRLRSLVSCCAQDALFVLDDLPQRGFPDAVKQTLRRSTVAHFNAQYDPRKAKDLVRKAGTGRGAGLDLSAYFNDSRHTPNWPDLVTPQADLAALKKATTVEYLGSHEQDDMNFCLHIRECPGACRIELTVAAGALSPAESGAFLAGLEQSLCQAADGEPGNVGFEPVAVDMLGM
jgi:hypothetical protein